MKIWAPRTNMSFTCLILLFCMKWRAIVQLLINITDMNTKFKMGIGIHFGRAYVGHLGHPKHRQFAVVGDPVNVASRIQGHTKTSGTQILLSDKVYQILTSRLLKTGQQFEVQLDGLPQKSLLHELVGFQDLDINLELQSLKASFCKLS